MDPCIQRNHQTCRRTKSIKNECIQFIFTNLRYDMFYEILDGLFFQHKKTASIYASDRIACRDNGPDSVFCDTPHSVAFTFRDGRPQYRCLQRRAYAGYINGESGSFCLRRFFTSQGKTAADGSRQRTSCRKRERQQLSRSALCRFLLSVSAVPGICFWPVGLFRVVGYLFSYHSLYSSCGW